MANRITNAEERFIECAMQIADLTRDEALRALKAFRQAEVMTIDAVGGQFTVKHGAFMEADVLRRAAK